MCTALLRISVSAESGAQGLVCARQVLTMELRGSPQNTDPRVHLESQVMDGIEGERSVESTRAGIQWHTSLCSSVVLRTFLEFSVPPSGSQLF